MERLSVVVLSLLAWLAWLAWSPRAHAESVVVDGDVVESAGAVSTAGNHGASLRLSTETFAHFQNAARFRHRAQAKIWFPRLGLQEADVIELVSGSVSIDVGEHGAPVVVRTSKGLTVATVGQAAVSTSASVALEGQSWIRKRGNWRRLEVGRRVRLDPSGGLHVHKSVLPAPKRVDVQRVWVARGQAVTVGDVAWSPVEGAQGYVLTLSHAGVARELLRQTYGALRSNPELFALLPGKYSVEVSAIDEHGLPGISSKTEIHVVGVSTPALTFSAAGVACVPKGSELTLSYAEGLEMRLDDSEDWFTAVPSLRLLDKGRIDFSLRYPQHLHAEKVTVVARDLKARVEIGPKTAVWPADRVLVAIELSDGADGSWASDAPIKIETTLGLEPIDVRWQRDGNRLSGAIEPSQGDGPWTVRVAVSDPAGKELGRGVLEVIEAPEQEHPPQKLSRAAAR